MKISKSKQELARIISENGGWREGAEWAAQDACGTLNSYQRKPVYSSGCTGFGHGGGYFHKICAAAKIKNWHQTILSRAEYFHLYPAPDADGWIEWNGGECPVADGVALDVKYRDGDVLNIGFPEVYRWKHIGSGADFVAYRLHKPEQAIKAEKLSGEAVLAAKSALMGDSIEEFVRTQTIEQLAADYRNSKDYADRKQQEADAAKADAEAKLDALVSAGKAVGLVLSVAEVVPVAPELVITDWRDLRVGDEVDASYRGIDRVVGSVLKIDVGDSNQPIFVSDGVKSVWATEFHFIRRP